MSIFGNFQNGNNYDDIYTQILKSLGKNKANKKNSESINYNLCFKSNDAAEKKDTVELSSKSNNQASPKLKSQENNQEEPTQLIYGPGPQEQ